jgi:hypothetical protein
LEFRKAKGKNGAPKEVDFLHILAILDVMHESSKRSTARDWNALFANHGRIL